MSTFNANQFALEFDTESPKKIIEKALEEFGNIAISFSGAEDVVLVEIASKVIKDKSQLQVFSLDTGRLHPETYQFIETVRKHYGIQIDIVSPEHQALEAFVKEKGLFSFFEDGHQECCGVRKVAPLRRKLGTLDAWITGQRKDQSPGTRNSVPVAEMDKAFGTEESPLVKFNPLANWSSQQVWEYIRMFDVP
ncbi:MAG: phosphoadenylyl-sulfate reductase, partial [Oceanospirillum sp.]|nr:phosphoadenylyl-sulfate reductase [Oceanospirillum sp.]